MCTRRYPSDSVVVCNIIFAARLFVDTPGTCPNMYKILILHARFIQGDCNWVQKGKGEGNHLGNLILNLILQRKHRVQIEFESNRTLKCLKTSNYSL